jgi:hypothetical protein
MRVRELAIQSIVEATAKKRLTRAARSQTRVAGKQLHLQDGDLVVIWRSPPRKMQRGGEAPAV